MTAVHVDVKPINCFIDGRPAFITGFGIEPCGNENYDIVEYKFDGETASYWCYISDNRIVMPDDHDAHVQTYVADYIAWGVDQYAGK